MGIFGYSFVNLTKEQVHDRRIVLDHYALVAQLSVFVILLGLQVYHLSSWLSRRCGQSDEEQTPSSPYLKAEIEFERTSWTRWTKRRVANIAWWMRDEVVVGWGTRSEWFCGVLWLGWLLALCINATGEDYMHLTKRFGIVAASQLPLHYLLAMKSAYSPLQILTRMSHEQLNSAHQVLGKVIQCLLTLHAIFYLNFFSRINVLAKRINDRDVILGVICIMILTIISTSAIGTVRRWSYRVFYTTHVVLVTLFLPLAYFHVHHIRQYILQSAGVYIIHLILRMINSRTQEGSITLIQGTSLIQVKIPLTRAASRYKPGQHLYLSLPQGHRGTLIPNFLLRNPFTVASLPPSDGEVVLVARVLKGNTASYANLAREADLQDSTVPRTLPLRIEGPYGAASHLPDFTHFERVLLIAGGVGATFILPIWRTVLAARKGSGPQQQPDLRLVWAVRNLSETSWALPIPELELHGDADRNRCEAEFYVTGVSGSPVGSADIGEGVELAETDALIGDDDEKAILKQGILVKRGRPDLHEITSEVCNGHVGRSAIFVCGPAGMSKQMRREVKRQVAKGKDIYWHAEEFGL